MIRRFLFLSTAHLQEVDRDVLKRSTRRGSSLGILTMRYPQGWFVFAQEEQTEDITDSLWAVIERARQLGCEYVMFDEDALILPGLPVFEQKKPRKKC